MSKSVRYYAGKAPVWYKSDDSDDEAQEHHSLKDVKEEKVEEQVDIVDSRISRLQNAGISQRIAKVEEEKVEERKRIAYDDEEEEMLPQEEESEGSEEESDEESEEDIKPAVLFKPIFNKTKKSIPTPKEDQKEERINTSHEMVVEELKRDLVQKEEIELDVDDTDGLNEEEELQAWKLRELSRIKRDALEKEKREQEEREIEENRKKTDKELEEEMEKNKTEDKTKIKFLQKYYHKGAFYADDEAVAKALKERDFTMPTLDDKVNKELLPAVMQVKNFGKSGRTKYTHLVDQDTTLRDAGWALKSDVNLKAMEKMGGVKRKFEGTLDQKGQKK